MCAAPRPSVILAGFLSIEFVSCFSVDSLRFGQQLISSLYYILQSQLNNLSATINSSRFSLIELRISDMSPRLLSSVYTYAVKIE